MIIVFGSINMDMVLPVEKLPAPGETVLGLGGYEMIPGGKGANQALAANRMGGKVALVGCVGDDGTGLRMVTGLRRDGVITSGVGQSPLPTGMAVILHNSAGENQIVVAPGANMDAKADQIPDEILKPTNLVLMQGETKPEENWILLNRAKKRGVKTILNLAPFIPVPAESFADIDYLILNEIEAQQWAATLKIPPLSDMAKLAQVLSLHSKTNCLLTLGAAGSIAATTDRMMIRVPALAVEKVIDTTGAGDAYCGTLAAALYSRQPLADAMKMASVAASLACTKKGAHESYPYWGTIEENLPKLGPLETAKF